MPVIARVLLLSRDETHNNMSTEKIHLGRSNKIRRQLYRAPGVLMGDLSAITRAVLVLSNTSGDIVIDSDVTATVFNWSIGNSIIEIKLGFVNGLTAGAQYYCHLILFDATDNPDGAEFKPFRAVAVRDKV